MAAVEHFRAVAEYGPLKMADMPQMMLFDETSGQIGTMWYEFTEPGVMKITEMDSTKYEARRK